MIFYLKWYEGSFLRACVELSARNLTKFVRVFVEDRYSLNIIAFIWAILDTITLLPSIKRNRKICEVPGSHWIVDERNCGRLDGSRSAAN